MSEKIEFRQGLKLYLYVSTELYSRFSNDISSKKMITLMSNVFRFMESSSQGKQQVCIYFTTKGSSSKIYNKEWKQN